MATNIDLQEINPKHLHSYWFPLTLNNAKKKKN